MKKYEVLILAMLVLCGVTFVACNSGRNRNYNDGGQSIDSCGCDDNNNEGYYIDLGLPSGTLWATMNIGASSPEEYGDYFAWGETEGYYSGKTDFSWSSYKYSKNDKNTLMAKDDAAYVNWDSSWSIPSLDQFDELINSIYTSTKYIECKGVCGLLITSRTNGASIFLPSAGRYDNTSLDFARLYGFYWSCTLDTNYPYLARYLCFSLDSVYTNSYDRYCGLSIRPVKNKDYIRNENTRQQEINMEEHEYVDLGLPSGTLWATLNVGASSLGKFGDYFAWGETEGYYCGKTDFSWSTYKFCKNDKNSLTKYCKTDDLTELLLEDDVAYIKWGNKWRIPSKAQWIELCSECTWTWACHSNGLQGRKVEGPNGNWIFLPFAGGRSGTSPFNANSNGYYWSRTLDTEFPSCAWDLLIQPSGGYWLNNSRYFGASVRPVRAQ